MSALPRRGAKGRRHKRGVHPLAVAVTLILVTAAIVYYAFSHSLPFLHHYTLNTVVNNSVNVRNGDPVRIAGIDVGAVSGVSPDGEATKIAFTLQNSGLPVHADATVRIRDRLFLEGSYYLELDPGSPSAPELRDGATIPESQTSTPVQFYNVLSTFDVATRANLTSLLNSLNEGFSPQTGHPLSDSGAGGFKSAIPQLQPVLKDTAWVTRSLRGTQAGDVENLLSSASQVTGTLAGSSSQLQDLITGLNQTSSALASTDGALAQTFSQLDQTLTAAPPALSAIDRALPPLAALSTALDPSLKVAPPIVAGVTATVQQLTAVLAPVQRQQLLTSLKATFEEFPAILSQLATAFPITKQVTDCLQTHVTPMLQRVVPDGSLTTGNPVWQDFVHFLPSLAGATGNFDANGPFTRTLAGAGSNSLTGGTLGSIPLIGQLVGSAPPGGGSLLGARPAWVGDLTASDFRPDVPCSTQPVPSLASPTAAADLKTTRTAAAAPLTAAQLRALGGHTASGANGVSSR